MFKILKNRAANWRKLFFRPSNFLGGMYEHPKVFIHALSPRYADGVGNTIEENSSVFVLIRMR